MTPLEAADFISAVPVAALVAIGVWLSNRIRRQPPPPPPQPTISRQDAAILGVTGLTLPQWNALTEQQRRDYRWNTKLT